jgi:hypothetical protein
MTTATHVYQVHPPADETYPRIFFPHTRNRTVDWARLGEYAQHGTLDRPETFDIFVKTDRHLDTVWIDGAGAAFIISDQVRATAARSLPGADLDDSALTHTSTAAL